MSGFPYQVTKFVEALRARPELARDPLFLDRMAMDAQRSFLGAHVALAAPLAQETWEAQGSLLATVETSGIITLEFPRPMEILGFICSVALAADPGPNVFVTPGLSDVLVQVEINKKETMTTGQQTTTGGDSSGFVTMRSLDLNGARLVGRKINTPSPKVAFTWRWLAGANVWPSVLPSVAVIWRTCDEE